MILTFFKVKKLLTHYPPASKPETEDDDAASEDNAATPRPTEYVPRSLRMTHPTEVKIHETKLKILD